MEIERISTNMCACSLTQHPYQSSLEVVFHFSWLRKGLAEGKRGVLQVANLRIHILQLCNSTPACQVASSSTICQILGHMMQILVGPISFQKTFTTSTTCGGGIEAYTSWHSALFLKLSGINEPKFKLYPKGSCDCLNIYIYIFMPQPLTICTSK
jgi:hypothetical protein